ncbi:MAG: beta-galactosidase [Clostridia bacterium]|nr:beta-galactosidase [Clostridia bacterium]
MSIPRPEHPKPQFYRPNWKNLNGTWDFLFDFSNSGVARHFERHFDTQEYRTITVPFCPESPLSGIGHTDFIPAVWYQRSFSLSKKQLQGRILIHFGAVDFHSILWVNGQKAGEHKGGYTSFSFDITAQVTEGKNTLILYAEDDLRSGKQPMGKQCLSYHSAVCSYTRTTGIWQTVWLEFVPKNYIKYVKTDTFAEDGTIMLQAEIAGDDTFQATVSYKGKVIDEGASVTTGGLAALTLKVPAPMLWDIGQPHLYDLTFSLASGDRVDSYCGFRKIALKNGAFYLNDRPVFMRTVLDQGFNPDGIYTAPNEEFLKRDIELSMELGFNGARFHQRIFEERSLYWADKLGYLVWSEYANGDFISTADRMQILLPEWLEAMKRDYNHPAIIGWAPENEYYHQAGGDTANLENLYRITKMMDPYRPVIDSSGGPHGLTDLYDSHDYIQDPEEFKSNYKKMEEDPSYAFLPKKPKRFGNNYDHYAGQPYWVSEYGGAIWSPDRTDGWGYGNAPQTEEEFAERYAKLTQVLLENPRICGFCYTQLTDVEQEQNGLYKYDRSRKFSDETYEIIRSTNQSKAAIEEEKSKNRSL